jgi:Ca2+-binding RTX toxin-like protein
MTTILVSSNIDQTGATAGLSAAASTTYIVDHNVHIGADSFGFVALTDGVDLENFGGVFSSGTAAVKFDNTGGSIVNEAGGSMAGTTGVLLNSTGEMLTNLGSIVGLVDDGIDQAGDGNPIDNRGYVYGNTIGVHEDAPLFSGIITNSGVIESAGIGIKAGDVGVTTSITNTGTIMGAIGAIQMSTGNLNLINSGSIVGDIQCYTGENDHIVNSGSIAGMVLLGGGNDTFIGTGGSSGEVVGGAGNDILIGGKSADLLYGGDGNDTLTGGPGADQFVFSAALNATTDVDKITDFSVVADRIDLDHSIFVGIGAAGTVLKAAAFYQGHHAHDASDRIIYDKTTGALFYDSNGNAAGGEVRFATLAHNLAVTHADFLVT